jgi:hypothetical protein
VTDSGVVAPAPGSLEKLADMFDAMGNDADKVAIVLMDIKVTPGRVSYAADFQRRCTDFGSAYRTKVDNLRKDFHSIADQLRVIAAEYKNTETANSDDVERLRRLVKELEATNPGIDAIMPTVPDTGLSGSQSSGSGSG